MSDLAEPTRGAPHRFVDEAADLGAVDGLVLEEGSRDGVETRTVLALTTNLGYATAVSPPPPKPGTPDPLKLVLPFIR